LMLIIIPLPNRREYKVPELVVPIVTKPKSVHSNTSPNNS